MSHESAPGLWVKFAKRGRGIASIGFHEALEVALRLGGLEAAARRRRLHVPRYQPRGPKSSWGQRNTRLAQRLIDYGLMRPAGLAAVQAAKVDGRWNA